MLAESGINNSQ